MDEHQIGGPGLPSRATDHRSPLFRFQLIPTSALHLAGRADQNTSQMTENNQRRYTPPAVQTRSASPLLLQVTASASNFRALCKQVVCTSKK